MDTPTLAPQDVQLDAEAAATLLGVTPIVLEGWRRRKVGPPYIKLGPKFVRYWRSQLLVWLKSCERSTSGTASDTGPSEIPQLQRAS